MKKVISVDIGGTKIDSAIISNHKIVSRLTTKTGTTKHEIIKNILHAIADLLRKSKISPKEIACICVGCPGPADYKKGIIGFSPNLPLHGVNLKKIIFTLFRKKVILENDANCFVLGEAIRLKKKNIVGLTLGTGVGGGIVVGGKLYHGEGNAGELGLCTINYDDQDNHSGRGSVESYLSGRAIVRRYHRKPIELSPQQWNEYGIMLGITLTNLIFTFDPEVIVLGGGISQSFHKFRKSAEVQIKKRIKSFTIIKGAAESSLYGAAALFQGARRW